MSLAPKRIIAGILIISLCSGCLFFNTTSFSLTTWTISDTEGFPSLNLVFNASSTGTITLTLPDSQEQFSDTFYRGVTSTSMPLHSYRTNPTSGRYVLRANDNNDNVIFEQKFVFEGANLSITNIIGTWWKEEIWMDTYAFVGLHLTVVNNGDLPAYPHSVSVVIGDETTSALLVPDVILPHQRTTLCCFLYITGLPSDRTLLNLTIKDIDNAVLAEKAMYMIPSESANTLEYRWNYNGARYLILPDPDCLYSYYVGLERFDFKDYTAYIFDVYDDEYWDLVADKLLDLFDTETGAVERVNAVASFIQDMEYVEDNATGSLCEYPRYPIEMVKDGEGDCEDKAILTATLLNTMGYNVSLLRLPEHMAVGIHLGEDASTFEYYIDEYYFLETSRKNWILGRVPPEYTSISNITVHPLSSKPIITHHWRNATRYTASKAMAFVEMKIIVQNVGSADAEHVEIKAAFYSGNLLYNQETTVIPIISVGEKKEVQLTVNVPSGISTTLKSQVYLNGMMIDEKESSQLFS